MRRQEKVNRATPSVGCAEIPKPRKIEYFVHFGETNGVKRNLMDILELITLFHKDAERQGPGSDETTRKAFSFVPPLPTDATILDLGCGTGASTVILAEETASINSQIIAVDLLPEFLGVLQTRIDAKNLNDRIRLDNLSMENLPYPPESFDLIWAEGSIYHLGFENGIRKLRPLLKPGGCIAVSEISWITALRPTEIENYWHAQYPEIDLVSKKTAQLEANGYAPLAVFTLPKECWTTHYYEPIRRRSPAFLEQYGDDPMTKPFIEEGLHEAETYDRFSDYYSYAFYVAKKA